MHPSQPFIDWSVRCIIATLGMQMSAECITEQDVPAMMIIIIIIIIMTGLFHASSSCMNASDRSTTWGREMIMILRFFRSVYTDQGPEPSFSISKRILNRSIQQL
jgi:hypothetical protein